MVTVRFSSYRSSSALWLNYVSLFPIVNPRVHIGMQWETYVVVRWETLLYKVRASDSGKSALLIFPPSTTASYTCPLYACPSSLCQTEKKNQGVDFVSTSPTAHVRNTRCLYIYETLCSGMCNNVIRIFAILY